MPEINNKLPVNTCLGITFVTLIHGKLLLDRSSQLISSAFEPPRGKTNNVVSEQVRHKPGCTSTEKNKKLEILDLSTRGIVLAKLICVFVFAYADCWFSHEVAHLLYSLFVSYRVKNLTSFSTSLVPLVINITVLNEPQCENKKNGFLGFRPGLTQPCLCSYRKWLEA